jgi:hypothetical protein
MLMANCLCKYCRTRITQNKAIKIVINDKNNYFCSAEHYNLWNKKYEEDKKEYNDFCELYEYIRQDIFGYSITQKLPKSLVTKLQDLRNGTVRGAETKGGNVIVNSKEGYIYPVIHQAFKEKYDDIVWCLKNKTFTNESHKINYIMTIVDGYLNDALLIYKLRMDILSKMADNTINTQTTNGMNLMNTQIQNKQRDISAMMNLDLD